MRAAAIKILSALFDFYGKKLKIYKEDINLSKQLRTRIILGVVALVLAAAIIAGNIVLSKFSYIINQFFAGDTTDYGGAGAELEEGDELVQKLGEESMVLLKNENDFLPLDKSVKVNLFGWAATDQGFLLVGGGSGGTVIASENKVTLTSALKKEGLEYNEDLLKAYYVYNYFFIGFIGQKDGHGLVRILDRTLKAALLKNDFEMIDRMNRLNRDVMNYYGEFKCGLISEDEIRVAKLKLDKSVPQQEIIIQSSIHNGIIIIDELLAVNDVDLIEQALEKYPISKYEQIEFTIKKIKQTVESDEWRFIFEYAVDHSDETLCHYILNNEKDSIESWLSDKEKLPYMAYGRTAYDFFRQNEKESSNLKYFQLRSKERFSGEIQVSLYNLPLKNNPKIIYNIYDLAEYIRLCKKQAVDDFKENYNTDKITKELSERFFRKELAEGNNEFVAIKLCVRLEAVLKSKFHYQGDFSDMLEQYCNQYGMHDEDDGWGYMQTYTDEFVPYLQKLRKYRNSIVHSDNKAEKMTTEELEFCIQYICNIN